MTEAQQREAFMAAIVKLADDVEFRKAFMRHYNLWLSPPMLVRVDAIEMMVDMRPGALTPVSEEVLRQAAAGELVFVPKVPAQDG